MSYRIDDQIMRVAKTINQKRTTVTRDVPVFDVFARNGVMWTCERTAGDYCALGTPIAYGIVGGRPVTEIARELRAAVYGEVAA